MDSSGNGNEYIKNVFTVFNSKKRADKLTSTSQKIEVDTFTSKILSGGVILLIFVTLVIGFTALRRSPTSVSQIAGDNLNVENFELIEHLESDNTELKKLQSEYQSMKADINSLRKRQPTQINKITQNKVMAPANRTSGKHYVMGPMIPKISSNSQLTCPSRTDTRATPLLKKNNGFISPDRTWSYEIDGTIRTAYNKKIDKMGSCMQVLDNNNINMTEDNNNCSKWTWNAKGQLRHVSSQGGHPKCLTVGKIKDSTDDGVYLSHCTDHASKVWSFFHSPPSTDGN